MANYANQLFVEETVEIDGNHYLRCAFRKCTLRYLGSIPIALQDCTFEDDTRLELLDSAANTAMLLSQCLRDAGLRKWAARYLRLNIEEVLRLARKPPEPDSD
jgi:hypothetical protein